MSTQSSSDENLLEGLGRIRRRAEAGAEIRTSRISELETEIAQLKTDLRRIRQADSLLAKIQQDYENGNCCEVVRTVDRSKDLREILDDFAPDTFVEISTLRDFAAKQAESLISEFSSKFPKALSDAGEELDGSSKSPVFKLRNGFFEIKLNKAKFEISLSIRHGATVKSSADVNLAVEAVLREIHRCFESDITTEEFSQKLRSSYSGLVGLKLGRPIPLDEVRKNFDGEIPQRDEFSVALSRVLREEPSGVAGMKLDHTKEIDTGFLLTGYEDRGYFGSISFS